MPLPTKEKVKVRVSTNVVSINSRAKLDKNIHDLDKASRALSTGDRINQAANDPAGLIISEGMKARIRSYGQAQRNANDSISIIQVAEGALAGIQDMANRMKELAMQAANDTLGAEDRAYVNGEYQQMKTEIRRILSATKFGGRKVLDTSAGNYQFLVGIHKEADANLISYDMSKVIRSTEKLSLAGSAVSTKTGSQSAISEVDLAINEISNARAWLGATQSRIGATMQNLSHSQENMSAANSRIRDADYAKQTAIKAISQLKTDASTGFLQHANNLPDQATRLL